VKALEQGARGAIEASRDRHTEERAEQGHRHTEALVSENRRFFQVIAEDLVARIQLVAEGVTAVDQKLDRFRAEVRQEFSVVDRRLLRLEAHASRTEDRP